MKNEIMKFWGSSKIWREISLQIIFRNFFFFFEKIIWREISSQILENPKNFIFSFCFLLVFELKCFPPEKDFQNQPFLPERDQVNSEDFV